MSEKAREILCQQLSYFESMIRDAQAEGLAAAGDPSAKAKCLFAFFEGSLAQARIHNDLLYLKHLPQACVAMLAASQTEGAVA